VADDLDGIYDAIKENALLAKFAGGLGNDWTPVRAWAPTSRAPTASRKAWCRS
jgi:ribonucleoside-diphosphate reductase alpha chain